MITAVLFLLSVASNAPPAAEPAPVVAPRIAETRIYKIRQTVALADVPATAKEVRLWVPIPTDGAWQHVLDRRVVEAPAGWKFEKQPVSDAEMVVATAQAGAAIQVVVETNAMRQSPVFDMTSSGGGELQPELFAEELRRDSPLMAVDPSVLDFAKHACADVTDPREKVLRLLDAVADQADHYSKDATKPNCGRGADEDCLTNGGGCCTDLHALFIAAARSQGVPARLEYG
ncbi:MAG: transglutaminase domain-containing protein [Planctomycetota bacterium]|nr:transglutaminase domain-containing protein [Planctomycetota bacterium]